MIYNAEDQICSCVCLQGNILCFANNNFVGKNLCAATLRNPPRRDVYLQEIMDATIAGVIFLVEGTMEAERRLLSITQTSSELKVVRSHSYVLSRCLYPISIVFTALPTLYPRSTFRVTDIQSRAG